MYLIDFSNKIYTLNGRKYERSITLKAGLEYSSRHIKKKKSLQQKEFERVQIKQSQIKLHVQHLAGFHVATKI